MKKLRKPILFFFITLLSFYAWGKDSHKDTIQLIEVIKIWDKADHNAFTDLIRFKNKWYCTFREASDHVIKDGSIRVISSLDGKTWNSVVSFSSDSSDLRDPKFSITPDGRLMVYCAEALFDKTNYSHQTLAWYSLDGVNWTEPLKIGEPDFWLWRISWNKKTAFGIAYGCGEDKSIRLYTSKDGKTFSQYVERLYDRGYPNETSMVFKADTAFCLLRRDEEPDYASNALLGVAMPPYKEWEWKNTGKRVGGPNMIMLPDGRLLAAVRLYENNLRTSLCLLNKDTGILTELLTLPSGGDTSYPGLFIHKDLLWISYYSSHQGKTSIYLAKVKF